MSRGGASLQGDLALDYRYRLNVPGTQCECFRLAFRATSGTPIRQRRGTLDSGARGKGFASIYRMTNERMTESQALYARIE